jgi:pyruvate kinase
MTDHPQILAKIIATVGPACEQVQTLLRMIEEGVRVFRINFSHGSLDSAQLHLDAVRQASSDAGIAVAVFGDLSGPKIRIGEVIDGGVLVEVGQTLRLEREAVTAAPPDAIFSTTWPAVIDDIQPGQRVLIDDGNVRALVTEREDNAIIANITIGGLITRRKGINLPDTDLKVPAITDHDWRCVDWALEHELDYLAMSFVRRADELKQLTAYVKNRVPIIAKIEKPQALDDLEAIIDAADIVMVARGDLGVEMDLTQVPIVQKRIVTEALDAGKPVIVATQMLESMIDRPTPTRAEVSDVANAILDGADAVMLSGETAVGKYPVAAVNIMARTAKSMQSYVGLDSSYAAHPPRHLQESRYRTAALAHGVASIVRDMKAKLIVVWSQHGGAARYLSQNRLRIPIWACTSDPGALRRMCILYGVQPILLDLPEDTQAFLYRIDQLLLPSQICEPGDPIVVVSGTPIGAVGVTNTLRIHYVGDMCRIKP